ncbi:MAG: hypothetical protein IPM46_00750 [Flavobacteriales bacterium]|nr:hypothetical protein [Flavobacteriales bacterium]
MRHLHLFLPVAGALLFAGCQKGESDTVDLGYGYFPRKVGAWIEYQVDSSWRDDNLNINASVSYRLKEKIVEEYTDPAGRTAWRIHRFVKNAADEWVIRDVWTSTMDQIAAEVTEENHRRQKLTFPVRNGRRWDINVYNAVDELEVAFREADKSWTGPTMVFPRTVLVRNTVPANVINKRNFEERWAHDVGMVFKYWEETNTQFDPVSGAPRVVGWRVDMAAVAYGTE